MLLVLLEVHGGIRHLENFALFATRLRSVHGGIRHLEKKNQLVFGFQEFMAAYAI